jgi:hypothetical protein
MCWLSPNKNTSQSEPNYHYRMNQLLLLCILHSCNTWMCGLSSNKKSQIKPHHYYCHWPFAIENLNQLLLCVCAYVYRHSWNYIKKLWCWGLRKYVTNCNIVQLQLLLQVYGRMLWSLAATSGVLNYRSSPSSDLKGLLISIISLHNCSTNM